MLYINKQEHKGQLKHNFLLKFKNTIEALSHGLKYYFSVTKLNYNKYFILMENVFSRVSECQMLKKCSDSANYFRYSFKAVAFRNLYSYQSGQVFHHKRVDSF